MANRARPQGRPYPAMTAVVLGRSLSQSAELVGKVINAEGTE
jgi:hypothetical protein